MAAQLRVVALLGVASYTAACPFGGTDSGPLPPGHPSIERRLRQASSEHPGSFSEAAPYPGYIVDDKSDLGSLSYQWVGDEPVWSEKLATLVAKSTEMGDAELCHWSFQTLPGPQQQQPDPSVTSEDVALWFLNHPEEYHSFLDMPVKRMQTRVQQDGVVVWTGCAAGRTLRRGMCRDGYSVNPKPGARLEDCSSDAVWNQTLMTPTAIVIFKIQGSKIDDLKSMLSTWRTGSEAELAHVPQMTSALVQKGWGGGGQIISKTVPCSQIPEKYMYQNMGDCDELGDSGALVADEAFEVWKGLCSVTKDGCDEDGAFRGAVPAMLAAAAALAALVLPVRP